MITLIEALNYRSLRYIRQSLGPFHILVGPNASGKTTFLDVVAFLGRLVSDGVESAVKERTNNVEELFWNRRGNHFELAIEVSIPKHLQRVDHDAIKYDTIRYQVSVGIMQEQNTLGILEERVTLMQGGTKNDSDQRCLFPNSMCPPSTIILKGLSKTHTAVSKSQTGSDSFAAETKTKTGKPWKQTFHLGRQKSSLGNLPLDKKWFPVSTWLKELLCNDVQKLVLNSQLIRQASPPNQGLKFRTDGSNLPWVLDNLNQQDPKRFRKWIVHLQTALTDLKSIRTVTRQDDMHRYLFVEYEGGLEVPSWLVSDGTLRMLALTLPAYLPGFQGIYLIEEPENGIHPKAIETVFQSLSSVYDAQILLASHSPVLLSCAKPEHVLCFAKDEEGATAIVNGKDHPQLKEWKGELGLGTLLASGVLG